MRKKVSMMMCAFLMCALAFTSCTKDKDEDEKTLQFTANGVSFKMMMVEAGTFQMGDDQSDAYEWCTPVHKVTLTNDYYMGSTEVTQGLWKAVMGSNPSYFKGEKLPVEHVSWDDVQAFITKLNELTGKTFRLPTEAEWEYAARGGKHSHGYLYCGSDSIGDVAWYSVNSGEQTHEVGTKAPNELGLYDMSGNVWEFCQDGYGNYSSEDQTNPVGDASDASHVVRGGGWHYFAIHCRAAYRLYNPPTDEDGSLGFRLALSK